MPALALSAGGIQETPAEAPPEPPGLESADDYWSRLVSSEENPGWLWDPVEEEWVADPDNPLEGDE